MRLRKRRRRTRMSEKAWRVQSQPHRNDVRAEYDGMVVGQGPETELIML